MHISPRKRIVLLLEIGLPKLEFDAGELPLKNPDQEVSAATAGSRKREASLPGTRFLLSFGVP